MQKTTNTDAYLYPKLTSEHVGMLCHLLTQPYFPLGARSAWDLTLLGTPPTDAEFRDLQKYAKANGVHLPPNATSATPRLRTLSRSSSASAAWPCPPVEYRCRAPLY